MDGVRAEVLLERLTVGSALRSCVSKIEIEGSRERKWSEKRVLLSSYVSVNDRRFRYNPAATRCG
jgi:hypothetical protein